MVRRWQDDEFTSEWKHNTCLLIVHKILEENSVNCGYVLLVEKAALVCIYIYDMVIVYGVAYSQTSYVKWF